MKRGTSLDRFNADIDRFCNSTVPERVLGLQAALVETIWTKILEYTPVYSGRARANWRGAINVKVAPYNPMDVGDAFETGEAPSGTEKERIKKIVSELKKMPLGQTVWLLNSTPYIVYLEAGSSDKAPAGMVARAIHEAQEAIKSGGLQSLGVQLHLEG